MNFPAFHIFQLMANQDYSEDLPPHDDIEVVFIEDVENNTDEQN